MKITGTRTDQLEKMFGAIPLIRLQCNLPSTAKISNPFIVVLKEEVKIVTNLAELLKCRKPTKVIWQWHGEWNSDHFSFTVGEYREWLKQNTSLAGL
jgi:hypothetical protein